MCEKHRMRMTSVEGYSLAYLQSEPDWLIQLVSCDACNLVMRDPMMVCGLGFCRGCIDSLVRTSSAINIPISEETVFRNRAAMMVIENLNALCETCKWQGKLVETDDHDCENSSLAITKQPTMTQRKPGNNKQSLQINKNK